MSNYQTLQHAKCEKTEGQGSRKPLQKIRKSEETTGASVPWIDGVRSFGAIKRSAVLRGPPGPGVTRCSSCLVFVRTGASRCGLSSHRAASNHSGMHIVQTC